MTETYKLLNLTQIEDKDRLWYIRGGANIKEIVFEDNHVNICKSLINIKKFENSLLSIITKI